MNNSKQAGLNGAYIEAHRCLNCWDPPCARGCPAGIEVSRFIKAIKYGDEKGAAEIIEKNNPFGLICGYICPQESLCQKNCTSNKLGRGIDIKGLQHYVVEEQRKAGEKNTFLERGDIPEQSINTGGETLTVSLSHRGDGKGKAAVIGAGPSGLVCALFLSKLGYRVQVFERNGFIGGKLTKGIPGFRLPKALVQEELAGIKGLLLIRYHEELGRSITLKGLSQEGFEAVYISCGKWKNKQLDIPGSDLKGVYDCETILTGGDWQDQGYRKAAVIGAGNVAMDTARMLIKGGLEEVHIFFIAANEEVTAWHEEREEAWRDGVVFHMLAIPEIIQGEDGKVKGLKFNRSQVLSGEDGNWHVKPLADRFDFSYPVDMVVTAIGSDADGEMLSGEGLLLDRTGHLAVDDRLATNIQGVYAGGDVIGSGRGTVVQAVADGKRAAVSIDNYLCGRKGNDS